MRSSSGAATLLPGHLPEIASLRRRGSGRTLAEAERDRITQAIEEAGGNKSLAARTLGISRNRLDRKLKAFSRAH